MTALMEAEALTKRFGAAEVLRGITLSFAPKEVVSVIGPSGSGKTTLLRCLAMLETPSAGEIRFDGRIISQAVSTSESRRNARAVRADVGMVFQHFNLWPHKTVTGNIIEAPMRVKGIRRADAIAQAEALLEKVGLYDKRDAYPARLSGGQQQRVAIARALVNSPALILADEPTGALDTKTSEDVMRIFRELNDEQGITIMLVTHEPDVADHARRIVTFRDGRVVSDRMNEKDAA